MNKGRNGGPTRSSRTDGAEHSSEEILRIINREYIRRDEAKAAGHDEDTRVDGRCMDCGASIVFYVRCDARSWSAGPFRCLHCWQRIDGKPGVL